MHLTEDNMTRCILGAAAALALALPSCAAVAQAYPNKPMRIVVPYAPGGPTDIVARVVGQKLSDDTGQPVIVDNRPGAGGLLGTDLVAKATPDGYTLLLCSSGPMAVSPALGAKLPYDPQRDIAPVTLVVTIPYLLLVNGASGPTSVKELIALAQKNPGKLNYGSAGPATTSFFAAALFTLRAKIDMVHVPYKGSAQAGTDLAGGHVQMMFEAVPAALRLVKTGKVRILGISTARRFSLMPDVPTISESGVPGFETNTWSGICTAGRTPPAIVERASALIVKGLQGSEMRQRIASLGAELVANSAQEFSAFIKEEQAKWRRLVRDTGAKAN